MNVEQAYNLWSVQYDTNNNKTRDLEAIALRQMLASCSFSKVLEVGCGTGKNSEFLVTKAERLVAVDLSADMLSKAREKLKGTDAIFIQADITQPWGFSNENFDLVTFSLVLEHINNLDFVFMEADARLMPGGKLYLGELHPFKQYTGTRARFNEGDQTTIVECYTHHISDFVHAAAAAGLRLESVEEYFDGDDRSSMPRILAMTFHKS